ncbi:MAG: hypothetical protein R3E08_05365 [Thiotrichaceae bacterium]
MKFLYMALLIGCCIATTGHATERSGSLREKMSNNLTTLATTNRNNGYREKINNDLTLVAIVDTPDGYTKDVDTVWRYGKWHE